METLIVTRDGDLLGASQYGNDPIHSFVSIIENTIGANRSDILCIELIAGAVLVIRDEPESAEPAKRTLYKRLKHCCASGTKLEIWYVSQQAFLALSSCLQLAGSKPMLEMLRNS